MSNLPTEWTLTTIGELSPYVQRGKSPKYTDFSELPVINQKCIRWHKLETQHLKFIHPDQIFAWDEARYIRPGDILWNSTGTGTVGRAYLISEADCVTPKVVDSHVTIVRACDQVDSRYLFNWIKGPLVQQKIEEMCDGTTNQIELSRRAITETEIPVAPFEEQKRIADKLDAVLARVDACRDRLDRIPGILKRFRQSVLAAATSGKLTEDWRIEKLKEIQVPIDMEGLLTLRYSKLNNRGKLKLPILANEVESSEFFELPESWCRVTLDQIIWSAKDGPHFSPKYVETGIPFISGGSIRPEGIDFSIAKFISPELHAELSTRCKPEFHDILYTKGGTTGIARVNTETRDFNVWVHVAVLKLVSIETTNPFFIQHVLNSPQGYIQSQRYTHGVGNQDLGLTRMIKTVIPLPPPTEQTEIVRRIESLFAYADRLEARYTNARAQVEKLTPSLLAKAFRGELTADWRLQNPDLISGENSAEALLAKIKAQREADKPTKKPKATKV